MKYRSLPPKKAYYDIGDWEYHESGRSDIDIIITERETYTGLLDAEGRELHRIKPEIGFNRD